MLRVAACVLLLSLVFCAGCDTLRKWVQLPDHDIILDSKEEFFATTAGPVP